MFGVGHYQVWNEPRTSVETHKMHVARQNSLQVATGMDAAEATRTVKALDTKNLDTGKHDHDG